MTFTPLAKQTEQGTIRIPGRWISPSPLERSLVAGRRVLIVGINYWPEPTGIAPYTTAMAEYLAAAGARSVDVFTGVPCYPSWTVPEQYRHGLRFRDIRSGVSIHRLKHVVPRQQDALRRAAYEFSFLAHAIATRVTCRPDVVVGVTPALAGAAAAAIVARRYRSRSVVVVQDLLGHAAAQSGISGGGQVARAVKAMESWALRRADAVAVVADAFRPTLATYGVAADRVHTVPNWSHIPESTTDLSHTRAALGWGPHLKVALHAGNMGLKQDLGNIIEAARLSQAQVNLRWVLMGDGSQRSWLEMQGRGLTNLQFLPLCAEDRYPDVLAAADVLLLNERPGVREMSLPSKLTSYFVSGRPVAAAIVPDGASADELARAGAANVVPPGEPAALLDLVNRIVGDPTACSGQVSATKAYAEENMSLANSMRRLLPLL